jgi:PEGA domain
MQASRRNCLCALFTLACVCIRVARAYAETLTIASTPPGASVEIDGKEAGTTPLQLKYPGGYFHKTHTIFGTRLEHSMTLRIWKTGYVAQRLVITTGPFEWVAINGRHHGSYWLLKSDHLEFSLETNIESTTVSLNSSEHVGPIHPRTLPASSNETESRTEIGSVSVKSDPEGAEIFVDGKFMGQTPSTIPLAAGPHKVVVKSPGRKDWQRELSVAKDSQLTLHPLLELQP